MEPEGSARQVTAGAAARAHAFAARHPVPFVLLCAPIIPELLSGSTPLWLPFVSPAGFVGLLLLEMGFYGSGVLLVREAALRWGQGWTGVVLLGAAFGVCEEGFTTILLPHAMGLLVAPPFYGQWLGVNWVWAAVILQLHTTYSITLQVLLLGLILPGTRGRSLLPDWGIPVALLAMVGCEVAIIEALTPGWVPPFPTLLLPLTFLVVLVALARFLPRRALLPFDALPSWSPRMVGKLGFLFAPSVVIVEAATIGLRLPAALGVLGMLSEGGAALVLLLGNLGRGSNLPHQVALASGMLLTDMLWGLLTNYPVLPLALALDAAVGYLLYRLWGAHRGALLVAAPPSALASLRPGG